MVDLVQDGGVVALSRIRSSFKTLSFGRAKLILCWPRAAEVFNCHVGGVVQVALISEARSCHVAQ